MAYFKWADDLVIDNGPIDEDHKRLAELVSELHAAAAAGHGVDVVNKILGQLLDYTAIHLEREEAEMAKVDFPNLENHKIGHVHFMENLRQLQRQYESGSITVATQLATILRDWLSLHIRRSDRELLDFIRRREKAQARAAR